MAKTVKLSLQWLVQKSFEVQVPDSFDEQDIEEFAFDCEDEFRDLERHEHYPVEIDYDGDCISILSLKLEDDEFDSTATYVEAIHG
jgi:hypothetical protein